MINKYYLSSNGIAGASLGNGRKRLFELQPLLLPFRNVQEQFRIRYFSVSLAYYLVVHEFPLRKPVHLTVITSGFTDF